MGKAEEGPAPAAIDWDAIRKQRDEFAELKWRGKSREASAGGNKDLEGVQVSLDGLLGKIIIRFSSNGAVCPCFLFPSGLPPLEKQFYVEAESVSALTQEEVIEWRQV